MAKEEMAKLTPKEGVETENAGIIQDGKPLTKEQTIAYIQLLEDRLKMASKTLKEMRKELELYQMQDYYQRAQLLCMVISNKEIDEQFRTMCQNELKMLVYPPKEETKVEQ